MCVLPYIKHMWSEFSALGLYQAEQRKRVIKKKNKNKNKNKNKKKKTNKNKQKTPVYMYKMWTC